MLEAAVFGQLLDRLKRHYDLVVVDSPPMGAGPMLFSWPRVPTKSFTSAGSTALIASISGSSSAPSAAARTRFSASSSTVFLPAASSITRTTAITALQEILRHADLTEAHAFRFSTGRIRRPQTGGADRGPGPLSQAGGGGHSPSPGSGPADRGGGRDSPELVAQFPESERRILKVGQIGRMLRTLEEFGSGYASWPADYAAPPLQGLIPT